VSAPTDDVASILARVKAAEDAKAMSPSPPANGQSSPASNGALASPPSPSSPTANGASNGAAAPTNDVSDVMARLAAMEASSPPKPAGSAPAANGAAAANGFANGGVTRADVDRKRLQVAELQSKVADLERKSSPESLVKGWRPAVAPKGGVVRTESGLKGLINQALSKIVTAAMYVVTFMFGWLLLSMGYQEGVCGDLTSTKLLIEGAVNTCSNPAYDLWYSTWNFITLPSLGISLFGLMGKAVASSDEGGSEAEGKAAS